MLHNYRHGDSLLIGINKLPSGLKKSKTNVFLVGKNNSHSIDKGDLYILKDPNTLNENEFMYGYLVAKNTKLIHSEHSHKGVKIKDGIYELYKQKEETPSGFKIVQD